MKYENISVFFGRTLNFNLFLHEMWMAILWWILKRKSQKLVVVQVEGQSSKTKKTPTPVPPFFNERWEKQFLPKICKPPPPKESNYFTALDFVGRDKQLG